MWKLVILLMQLEIPDQPFKAYIFDCDGTVADSMPIHHQAWQMALAEFGAEFPEELHLSWGGMPNTEIIRRLSELNNLQLDAEVVSRRKHDLYLERAHLVRPIESVLKLARQLRGTAPMAIASGGRREVVMTTLEALDVVGLFDIFVCAEDYSKGKPDPEPFLLAASKMRVAPEDCLVFEDSPTGVEAAQSAGMQYVLVPPSERTPAT